MDYAQRAKRRRRADAILTPGEMSEDFFIVPPPVFLEDGLYLVRCHLLRAPDGAPRRQAEVRDAAHVRQ